MQARLLCPEGLFRRYRAHPRLFFSGSPDAATPACTGRNHILYRFFLTCTTRKQANTSSSSSGPSIQDSKVTQDSFVYHGPLTKAFRNLKIFSLSSIGLTVSLSPILLVVDSGLPMSARIALAGIALGTSSLSTALIAYCAKPYVISMRRFRPDKTGSAEVIEMTTQSLFLKPIVTTVYDPSFLLETTRPFAQWELASKIHLTPTRIQSVGANVHPEEGLEETVAETKDINDNIIGRWVVKWAVDGAGTCHQVGHVVRFFNVHEELLQ